MKSLAGKNKAEIIVIGSASVTGARSGLAGELVAQEPVKRSIMLLIAA